MKILEIDRSLGHGGGQILRNSLVLSMALGTPFRLVNIRADRKNPGLRRQHLTGVLGCTEICNAHVENAELGSDSLLFVPGKIKAGNYKFSVGSSGSIPLVYQSILLPLALTESPSNIIVEGGTYNPCAPSIDFFVEAYLPRLRQMGYRITGEMVQAGFHSVCGGLAQVTVEPSLGFKEVDWTDLENYRKCEIRIYASAMPERTLMKIAKYLRQEFEARLKNVQYSLEISEIEAAGSGAVIQVFIPGKSHLTILNQAAAYGISSYQIASALAKECKKLFVGKIPIEPHLADQLILPLFFAKGGKFCTSEVTGHMKSGAAVLEAFTGKQVKFDKQEKVYLVEVPALEDKQ